jgi:hypothetical protein
MSQADTINGWLWFGRWENGNMTIRLKIQTVAVGLLAALMLFTDVAATLQRAAACPFCSAAMATLGQEIAGADGAVIAELIKPMPAATDPAAGPVDPTTAAATFRIVKVLRGEEKLAGAKEIDVVYFGEDAPDKKFLITGIAAITPDKIEWTTPVPLSPRAVEYVEKLPTLPETGVERIAFFQEHLEDEDPLLAQDAYDEFARAPYADVIAIGPRMHRDKLLQWIKDPKVGPSGRRLYLTMLGICGQPEDVTMIEEFLNYDYQVTKPGIIAAIGTTGVLGAPIGTGLIDEAIHADERRKKESLDALIACYIKLKGPNALELVNEKFLGNPTVEYKHLHSAIMALRFHGEETDIIPREQLLDSMRLALDHKEFADQVIPDLTRWEDWDVMPRLVKMFKDAPVDDWIRQPVASYVLVAAEQPGEVGEKGKAAIAELEAIDADTVERARSLSAFSFLAKAAAADAATPGTTPAADATTATPAETAKDPAAAAEKPAADALVPAVKEPTSLAPAAAQAQAGPQKPAAPVAPVAAADLPVPSKLKLIGVPLLAAVVLLAIFAVLLRGTDPRSAEERP